MVSLLQGKESRKRSWGSEWVRIGALTSLGKWQLNGELQKWWLGPWAIRTGSVADNAQRRLMRQIVPGLFQRAQESPKETAE